MRVYADSDHRKLLFFFMGWKTHKNAAKPGFLTHLNATMHKVEADSNTHFLQGRRQKQTTLACMPTHPKRFFECHCSRCDAAHDVWRGFRCPRCHEGVVYPPNAGRISPRPPADVGYGPAPGVSACTACGRVPTASWLRSANKLEVKVSDVVEEVARNDYMAHLAHKDMPRAWKV